MAQRSVLGINLTSFLFSNAFLTSCHFLANAVVLSLLKCHIWKRIFTLFALGNNFGILFYIPLSICVIVNIGFNIPGIGGVCLYTEI